MFNGSTANLLSCSKVGRVGFLNFEIREPILPKGGRVRLVRKFFHPRFQGAVAVPRDKIWTIRDQRRQVIFHPANATLHIIIDASIQPCCSSKIMLHTATASTRCQSAVSLDSLAFIVLQVCFCNFEKRRFQHMPFPRFRIGRLVLVSSSSKTIAPQT